MASTSGSSTVEPRWKLGMFQILFVSMGQGDCCVVTCPDGAHIMIDCGSSKGLDDAAMSRVQDLIRSTDVLQLANSQQGRLEALILTHSDKDHISKVAAILGGVNLESRFSKIPINKVYFSEFNESRGDYLNSPLRIYDNGCSDALYQLCEVQEMYCVTVRDGPKVLDKWTPPFDKTTHAPANGLIAEDRVTVNSGTLQSSGTTWEVSIIAGNVKREYGDNSDNDGCNAASLVTLIRLDNDRALICGDATRSTENYLYKTYRKKGDIKNINLLQVPHHGSSGTSSTKRFVQLVKPQKVVISVHKMETVYHLPRLQAINSYIEDAADDANHPVQGWRDLSTKSIVQFKNEWETCKVKYTVENNKKGDPIRYVLTNAPNTFKGAVVLDGFIARNHYELYQKPITKDIRQTGVSGHLFYYFP
jgi:beta-lactamase superfamily II metal-dependent hydrolase